MDLPATVKRMQTTRRSDDVGVVVVLRFLTGESAAQFIASGDPVDIMLLDIRMSGQSGLDVVKALSAMPPYPIVAMTGHVDADAQQDFR